MARVRSFGNATTELAMARLLRGAEVTGWRRGSELLGRPDFVWPRERLAVFTDGCFWHGHAACGKRIVPKANAGLWVAKIERNQRRDRRVARALRARGWRVVRLWECKLKRRPETCVSRVRRALAAA